MLRYDERVEAELRAIRAQMDGEQARREARRAENTLRWHRYNAGLSQTALALAAGVSRHPVRYTEEGRGIPRRSTQQRIAAALGITPQQVREWQQAGVE